MALLQKLRLCKRADWSDRVLLVCVRNVFMSYERCRHFFKAMMNEPQFSPHTH